MRRLQGCLDHCLYTRGFRAWIVKHCETANYIRKFGYPSSGTRPLFQIRGEVSFGVPSPESVDTAKIQIQ
jgi:hypothetical protein